MSRVRPQSIAGRGIPLSGAVVRSGVLLALMWLGACATAPRVLVDAVDPLPECQSFTIDPLPEGEVRSLVEQRVAAAVTETMLAKGYVEDAENPDCRIAYILSERVQVRPGPSVGVGAGGGSGRVGGGVGVTIPVGEREQVSRTLTLDIIDHARNLQVWRGRLDGAIRGGEAAYEEVAAAVRMLLAEFPDRD